MLYDCNVHQNELLKPSHAEEDYDDEEEEENICLTQFKCIA